MARAKLSEMLDKFEDVAGNTGPIDAEPATTEVTERAVNRITAGGPRYLAFTRKEARLRDDQLDALAARARTLQRAGNAGERITDNTLIRVAIDLLLTRANELTGDTEIELRQSLGL